MQLCLCTAVESSPLGCWGWSHSCKQRKQLPLVWGHSRYGDWAEWPYWVICRPLGLENWWNQSSWWGFQRHNKEMPIWVMHKPYKRNGHEYNWAIPHIKCDSADKEAFWIQFTLKERAFCYVFAWPGGQCHNNQVASVSHWQRKKLSLIFFIRAVLL